MFSYDNDLKFFFPTFCQIKVAENLSIYDNDLKNKKSWNNVS